MPVLTNLAWKAISRAGDSGTFFGERRVPELPMNTFDPQIEISEDKHRQFYYNYNSQKLFPQI